MTPVAPPKDRARDGNPAVTAWCANCNAKVVPLDHGKCGWCGELTKPIPVERPQHMDALEQANRTRLASAAVYTQIKSLPPFEGIEHAAQLLERTVDPDLQGMRVDRLVQSTYRCGNALSAGLLEAAGIRRGKPKLKEMTVGQRRALATALRARAAILQTHQGRS